MGDYEQFRKRVEGRLGVVEAAIGECERLGEAEPEVLARWRAYLADARASLAGSLVRVAVVGSVKSGKSTLVNALLGRDLLRRGAGIVTAFITRVRTDGAPGGWVELKSLAEAAAEVDGAARLLPVFRDEMGEREDVDIRNASDRAALARMLDAMRARHQNGTGRLDPNFLLLSAYLSGYETVGSLLSENGGARVAFGPENIEAHQGYVADEGRAVFVRDMELAYPVSWLGEKVEVADCQGSDAPNPLHFALLQQYLLRAHLVLYVIGSRTGLREADFRLLDFVKTLRMAPQTIFVLNADLDAHPGAPDLSALADRVRAELSWVIPEARLHTFSALYHLTEAAGDAAPERERERLALWRREDGLSGVTRGGFSAFREDLATRLSRRRTRILYASGLSRLTMTAQAVRDAATARKALLTADASALHESARRLKGRERALEATLATLENSIAGLREGLEKEAMKAFNRAFDTPRGPIISELLDLVARYPVDPRFARALSDPKQVLRALYDFYMEFRQAISRYLVEVVNLRVIAFAKDQECFLRDELERSSRAFWSLFRAAIEDYREELARCGIALAPAPSEAPTDWCDFSALAPSSFSALVAENAISRKVLLAKFGLGRAGRFLAGLRDRIGRLRGKEPASKESENLAEAIALVRAETREELLFAFRDFRQNVKFGYLMRLIETGAAGLLSEFQARAQGTRLDFAALLSRSEVEGGRREEVAEALAKVAREVGEALEDLETLRVAVSLE